MTRESSKITDSRFLMRVGAVLVATSLVVFGWLDSWAFGSFEQRASLSELFSQRQFGFRLVWLGFMCWALAHINHRQSLEPQHGQRWRIVWLIGIVLAFGTGRLGAGAPLQAIVSTSLLAWAVWLTSRGVNVGENHNPVWRLHRVVAGRVLLCSLLLDLYVVLQDAMAEQAGLTADGADAQVSLAMFRLARMASAAIPLFLLMHHEIREDTIERPLLLKWVPKIFLFGAVALPLLLVLPPVVWMPLKYAMPLGSDAVLIGVGFTAYWAFKKRLMFEFSGWLILAISMNMGLLMGAYAFDGPFSPPEFVGDFLDAGRRLLRSMHVELIVAATALIFVDRRRRSTGVFAPIIDTPTAINGDE